MAGLRFADQGQALSPLLQAVEDQAAGDGLGPGRGARHLRRTRDPCRGQAPAPAAGDPLQRHRRSRLPAADRHCRRRRTDPHRIADPRRYPRPVCHPPRRPHPEPPPGQSHRRPRRGLPVCHRLRAAGTQPLPRSAERDDRCHPGHVPGGDRTERCPVPVLRH